MKEQTRSTRGEGHNLLEQDGAAPLMRRELRHTTENQIRQVTPGFHQIHDGVGQRLIDRLQAQRETKRGRDQASEAETRL